MSEPDQAGAGGPEPGPGNGAARDPAAPVVDAEFRRMPGLPPVGPIALGTWRMVGEVAAAAAAIDAALAAGMNMVDTADVYGLDHGGRGFGAAEELLGDVFRSAPSLRDSVVLVSKGGIIPGVPYDSSDGYLRAACEASLNRLGVERIDLYLVHRPDPLTHASAMVQTLDDLRSAGKIRAWGLSNHTVHQHDSVAAFAGDTFVAHQIEYSALELSALSDGTLDRCVRDWITPLVWSPLAGGRLANGEGVRVELIDAIDGIARREGVERATVAIAFVLAHPARPVAILGTQTPSRIEAATKALEITLTRSDVYDIIEASTGSPLP